MKERTELAHSFGNRTPSRNEEYDPRREAGHGVGTDERFPEKTRTAKAGEQIGRGKTSRVSQRTHYQKDTLRGLNICFRRKHTWDASHLAEAQPPRASKIKTKQIRAVFATEEEDSRGTSIGACLNRQVVNAKLYNSKAHQLHEREGSSEKRGVRQGPLWKGFNSEFIQVQN